MQPSKPTTTHRPVVLLDEAVFGLDIYLQDEGWTVEKVKPGTDDGEVVKLARDKGLIVLTPDRKLASRLRAQNVKCLDISFEEMAPTILEWLDKIAG